MANTPHNPSDTDGSFQAGHHTLGPRRYQATPGTHRHKIGTDKEGYISVPLFEGEAPASILELVELLEEYGLDGSNFTVSVEYITRWRFDSGTAVANPGTGKVGMNGTVSPTILSFNKTTHLGGDATNYLLKLATGDQIFLQKLDDAGRFYRYQVTGNAVDHTSWFEIPVALLSKGGTLWSNNDILGVAIIYITTGGGGGSGGGVTDHGALTGLADNDHPQYLLATAFPFVRTTASITTASLANNATENGTITLAAGYRLLKVDVNKGCRVRLYTTSAARSADASRPVGTDVDIATDHGLVFEYVATAAIAPALSPTVDGFAPSGSTVYYAIENRSGSTGTVAVTFTYVRTE